ncbi:PREDICTED: beta-defensin 119-like [Miniopterus natalensis]|uniref:beta-defensin 119-like n=1 Tax=Miniopterus natalensis TaxID=291302 RepID=UPI0007A6FA21|nr:PREDICTED: beta-defensin 119-like [Miniopterus natalensis]
MKSLFLLFAVLLALEPVVSGRHYMLRCMGNMGTCRTSCRKAEHPYLYCRNYQPCCLPSYMRINLFKRENKSDRNHEKR